MENHVAILLRKIKFSDTSLIVEWLTREAGRVKTIAKGALRPKSAFAGRLDLFFESEIAFRRSRASQIHALAECRTLETHEPLRDELARLEMAAYFVELLEATTELEAPVPELFELMRRALRYLEANEPSRRALLHFESELARLLGIGPEALFESMRRQPPARARLLTRL